MAHADGRGRKTDSESNCFHYSRETIMVPLIDPDIDNEIRCD